MLRRSLDEDGGKQKAEWMEEKRGVRNNFFPHDGGNKAMLGPWCFFVLEAREGSGKGEKKREKTKTKISL